jgi:hypothetical protein
MTFFFTFPIAWNSILAKWKINSSQLLYARGLNDVTPTEIHTAEPLVPEPSAFEVEMAIKKLKGPKSTAIDQISAELIKAGCRTIRSEIHKLVNSVLEKGGIA